MLCPVESLSELFCPLFVEIILRVLRLQSKGINFYDATLQGYNEDKDGSYDVSYMKLNDMYEDLLLPEGANYHPFPIHPSTLPGTH